jgi:predicted membrane protein (TIGR00267 family)
MGWLATLRARLLEGGDSIARRYFISNGFDGTLTSIGVAVGAYLSGIPSGLTIIKIGLGAAVGLGTSGLWSVWEIERAETRIERHRLERAMLADLDETRLARRQKRKRRFHALMSGFGPIIGVLIPMSAYLLAGSLLTIFEATLLAVALGVGLLFVFGAYLGSLSKQDWYVAGARMGLAGLVVAAINLVLPG